MGKCALPVDGAEAVSKADEAAAVVAALFAPGVGGDGRAEVLGELVKVRRKNLRPPAPARSRKRPPHTASHRHWRIQLRGGARQ